MKLSLQMKVASFVAASIFVTAFVMMGFSAFGMKQQLKTDIESESRIVGALLAENSAGALRFKKTEALTASLAAVHEASNSYLDSALVFAADGTFVASHSLELVDVAAPANFAEILEAGDGSFDQTTMTHVVPVLHGKKKATVGAIVLVWSNEAILKRVTTARSIGVVNAVTYRS